MENSLRNSNNFVTYNFKCANCNRILEVTRDIIMVVCPCGYTNEFKIDIKIEVENES